MNTAFLFSAGRGLRLRPLTDTTPKPLCTINQIALIDYHLQKLNQSTDITRVFINHAYLGDKIKRHINPKHYEQLEIIYVPEPPGGLLTGGTILHVLPQLDNTPFLAINADIFTDYDFSNLICPENSLAHLVLTPMPHGDFSPDFGLTAEHVISDKNKNCIFSGIACYRPALFNSQPNKRASLIPWVLDAAAKGRATGEIYTGRWFDTGRPARLEAARNAAQSEAI
jgi:N-acetyl-alpha-D-muramate 1-phosphate uridylyltransferase